MTAAADIWGPMTAALGMLAILSGCAHLDAVQQPLKVEIDPTPSAEEPGIVDVVVTNLTGEDRCIRRDALANPQSGEAGVRLRFEGRSLPRPPEGYIIPPKAVGLHRLPPGSEISFRLDVRGRYDTRRFIRPGLWEAQVGINSVPCSSPYVGSGSTSWSSWAEFAYPRGSGTR